jgi:hypothetical protein
MKYTMLNLLQSPIDSFGELDIVQISQMPDDLPRAVVERKRTQEELILREVMSDDLDTYTAETVLDLCPLVRTIAHLPISTSLAKSKKNKAI